MKQFNYEYIDNDGKEINGVSIHESCSDALNYYRSLESNGKIRMKNLTDFNGTRIWSNYRYGRLVPKI